jgi:hypothetical protein
MRGIRLQLEKNKNREAAWDAGLGAVTGCRKVGCYGPFGFFSELNEFRAIVG